MNPIHPHVMASSKEAANIYIFLSFLGSQLFPVNGQAVDTAGNVEATQDTPHYSQMLNAP